MPSDTLTPAKHPVHPVPKAVAVVRTSSTVAAEPMVRLLIVVDGNYPSTGGAELQVRLLSKAFSDRGHAVEIVCPRLDKSSPPQETIDGVAVTRLDYPHVRFLGGLILMGRFARYLWQRRAAFDAIHIHMVQNLTVAAGLLRPWLKVPVFGKISGAWEFDGGFLDPRLQNKFWVRLANRALRRIDAMQAISDYTRERLLQSGYPEAKILMIPNAVDLSRCRREARPSATARAATVAYVGRLRPVKGVDVLIRAWPQVLAAGDATLLIAGDGHARESFERLAGELGVSDRIKFLGNVSDVSTVLKQTDVYVQPSRQEGMPNSVLEAMGCGLPVVATKVSGNLDLVQDGVSGLLVTSEDDAAMASAITRLLNDAALRQQMGVAARASIEQRYDVPVIIAQLLSAYRGRMT
jgi:glycosyltransferase involved in cell wall biosynthesis